MLYLQTSSRLRRWSPVEALYLVSESTRARGHELQAAGTNMLADTPHGPSRAECPQRQGIAHRDTSRGCHRGLQG